jgi:hypothetical protein
MVLSSMASPGAGTPRTSSEEITGMLQFARLRAESNRVIHRVRFESTQVVSIWNATVSASDMTPQVGFGTAGGWDLVQQMTLPANAVLFGVATASYASGGAPTPTANQNLPYDIEFYPDGSVKNNGVTIFIGDTFTNSTKFRIAVFRTTGGAIAREGW